ncbi:hypothetical protein [Desulfobotulus sp.]|uniref:hypothetical protein n=1 Tax=Desulfobotulus sp. TaxID=1940337 RepID=UPI002A35BEAA|nr:hypothetical protein [Desulfobotulus sp.]MDY0162687.1 hypothetical protein [Desulfobotulus sp.]
MDSKVYIERRFCGPSQSGNGGYVCGRIASFIPGTATVRLVAPPPMERSLDVRMKEGKVQLLADDMLVGEGRSGTLDILPPSPPSFEAALEASKAYAGFKHHSFPRCFVCGPQREEGDGLRIFAGKVAGGNMVASPWIVDASLEKDGEVSPAFVWAALDCPGAFAVASTTPGMTLVLGELTARIEGRVCAKDRCVAVGWPLAVEGRKRMAGSAVFTESGRLVGLARAVWVEIPESLFPPENPA